MVLYPNKLPESERVCSGICTLIRGKKAQNCIGISILEREVANEFPEDYIIQPEDALVCYGLYANFMKFWKSIR